MNQETSFHYTYSAEQRSEIEQIRKKYLPPQEDRMETLRRLHQSAYQKAQTWSITIGVIGTLVLGTGMSLILTDLGASLGHFAIVLGILVGLIGMVLIALAYPVYVRTLRKERQRIAPEILRLTEELLK